MIYGYIRKNFFLYIRFTSPPGRLFRFPPHLVDGQGENPTKSRLKNTMTI